MIWTMRTPHGLAGLAFTLGMLYAQCGAACVGGSNTKVAHSFAF